MPGNSKGRPTLRTIADIAGLAVPTVSRALSDAPDIGSHTKARVRKIAEEIGYVPNRAGLRLRTGKTNVISMVLGEENDITDHVGRLVRSIASAFEGTQYHLNLTPAVNQTTLMNPVRHIVEMRSADAIILAQIERNDPRVDFLMKHKFPFATYGRTQWREEHPYFDFDNSVFGREAVSALVRQGRKSLALLAPPWPQNYAQDMISGAKQAASASDVRFMLVDQITGDRPREEIEVAMAEFFRAHADVDGLICPSANSAVASVVAAEKTGRSIGDDLDVFAKEALPFLKHFRPKLLSIAEDVQEAGRFLAKAAIQAIEAPNEAPLQCLSKPKFFAATD